jgi:hypothetical protein
MGERDIIKKYTMKCKHQSFPKGFSSVFFFILFIGVFSFKSHSQMADSIQASFKKKPHFMGGLGTKNTFINGFNSPIYTARVGVDFDSRIKLGFGVSWLKLSKHEVGKNNIPFYIDINSGIYELHPALQFRYANLFIEYVYFKTGKWEFSIPIQVGLGDSRYKYSYNGKNIIMARHLVFLYEPAVSGQYKIINWFGVGLEVGYRIMIISNKNIGSKFNSPVYDIKTIIFWGELYKEVLKKVKVWRK